MAKIIPIKELRNTNKISEMCNKINEPIFISKNGYEDLVICSNRYFENQLTNIKNYNLNIKKDCKNPLYLPKIDLKYKDYKGFGFIKVGCANFKVEISNVIGNLKKIKELIKESAYKNIKILVFPELCLSGYSCGDLFYQNSLQVQIEKCLIELKNYSKDFELLFTVGAPIRKDNSIYNCAVTICKGKILGIVPKSFLPNYNEFYEARQFTSAPSYFSYYNLDGENIPFYNKLIFTCLDYKDLNIGIELCEDLWVPNSPNLNLALNGATIILNLSASNEIVGKKEYRESLVSVTSSKLICGYLYCSCGEGESTTDVIYSGAKLIYENGACLKRGELFESGVIYSDLDIEKIMNQRRKMGTYFSKKDNEYLFVPFSLNLSNEHLSRSFKQNPFIASDLNKGLERYRFIMRLQSEGLKKRIEVTNSQTLLVGLSGGLDSTLALLVAVETFKLLKRDLKNIYAITLPCFGTSKRTHDNALKLANELGVTFKEVNINNSVLSHFKDINHDLNNKNACYENAQARERTQVLLDIANDLNGLMVGTGDLSELCLGWTTYNGDHMSSYGVNASIPKTLVKEIVRTYALDHKETQDTLLDIINTPISPELLPTIQGEIAQKTEDKIGPYEVHDFIIYYYLRHNFSFEKIYYLLKESYKDKYSDDDLKKWLTLFIKRFFTSQFKRSCLPDGVKVGTVSISPRGDFRMPSDASFSSYLNFFEKSKK